MKTFRWKVKPGMDVASVPSVKVRFGDGYSQRAPAGLNANLKTYSVTLSVPVRRPRYWSRFWKSTGLESLSVDAALWWRQIKVTCAKWSSRVSMLRVEFSAEFEQVVN
ncbi:phage tail protein [Escherichia coli]|nr:phage tail protein [Escherichia coli]